MCHVTHKWTQQNVGENTIVKYHTDVLKLQKTDSQMPNVSLDSLDFSGLAWTLKN